MQGGRARVVRIEVARAEAGVTSGAWLVGCAVAVALCVAVAGAFCSAIEIGLQPFALLSAVLVACAECALARSGRAWVAANAVLAVVCMLVLALRPGVLATGFDLLAASVYRASMAHQAYEYPGVWAVDMGTSGAVVALQAAVAFCIAVISGLLASGVARRRLLPFVATACVLVERQVYFGIEPGFAWSVACAVSLLVAAAFLASERARARSGGHGAVGGDLPGSVSRLLLGVAVAGMAVSGVVWAAYPADVHEVNPAVQAVSDDVRDYVASPHGASDVLQGLFGGGAGSSQGGASSDTAGASGSPGGSGGGSAVLDIPWLLLVLLTVMVVAFVFALILLLRYRRLVGQLRSDDVRVASHAAFMRMMRAMRRAGLQVSNSGYTLYVPQVSMMFGDTAGEEYATACGYWQQVRYGPQVIDAESACDLRALCDHLADLAKRNTPLIRRLLHPLYL